MIHASCWSLLLSSAISELSTLPSLKPVLEVLDTYWEHSKIVIIKGIKILGAGNSIIVLALAGGDGSLMNLILKAK